MKWYAKGTYESIFADDPPEKRGFWKATSALQDIMGYDQYRAWFRSAIPARVPADWSELCGIAYRKLYILTSDCTCLPDCATCQHCQAIAADKVTVDTEYPL